MQFTKEGIKLAKPFNDALKKIAERQKCPECNGVGRFALSKEGVIADPCHTHIKCPKCNGTGKGKWEWEPEVGEWCIYCNKRFLISHVSKNIVEYYVELGRGFSVKANLCIPFLPWETIEKILEGMGYVFQSPRDWLGEHRFNERSNYELWISTASRSSRASAHKDFRTGYAESKSRQLAVMRAVIELAKKKERRLK